MITVVNIYTFYKRGSHCKKMMSSTSGFSRSRYLRLMAISSVEVFGTIPLSTYYIVSGLKTRIQSWKSWADTHSHYSEIEQLAAFIWKNNPDEAVGIEMFRWSLVACAFIFFALFGFAAEAREQYYRLYKFLTRRNSTSASTPHRAPRAYVVFVHCVAPSSFIRAHYLFWQYSISPLCKENRWCHGSYPSRGPNESG